MTEPLAKFIELPQMPDPRGNLMLMGGAMGMAMGIFVMRRMINFKF